MCLAIGYTTVIVLTANQHENFSAYYSGDFLDCGFVNVVVDVHNINGAKVFAPIMEEFFEASSHIRTGTVITRDRRFKVYYHRTPPYFGVERHRLEAAVLFQINEMEGTIESATASEDLFHEASMA